MRSSEIDPQEARETARDILSGAEYSEPEESLISRAVGWVLDRLGDAIATLTGGGPGSVIGWLIVAALVGGAVWLLVRSLQVPGAGPWAKDEALHFGTATHRDPDAWRYEADRLAAEGDHRGALRCRYQALVARLITDGVVDDVPGRTSGEYRILLGQHLPQHTAEVDRLSALFESVWYGGQEIDAATFAAFAAGCETVEHAAVSEMAIA